MDLSLDHPISVKNQSCTACFLRSNLELIWSTYFGGNNNERGTGLSYSPSDERLYFCGRTTTNNSLLSPSDNFLPNFDFDDNNLNDYWQVEPFQDTDLPAWAAFFEVDVLNDPNLSTKNVIETSTRNIRIYPNPAQDFINILATDKMESVRVLNYAGQLVYELEKVENNVQIPLDKLSNGVYVIRVATNNNTFVRKFVKQ